MNIGQLLELGRQKLGSESSDRVEVEILLGHALEAKRSFLYANPDMQIPQQRQSQFQELLHQRSQGSPIAYLTGRRDFWTLELYVTPAVLIPRPETELLVEQALELIPQESQWRIADLGTGSGAIALALAHERPECEIYATEYSIDALKVAEKNAQRNGLSNVQFLLGSWTEPLTGIFDLIVCNPPYVAADDPHLHQGDCRFEPPQALSPGGDGLSALRQVALEGFDRLAPGAWLLLEHGYDQGLAVRNLMSKAGFEALSTVIDLAGHERVCKGKRPAA